MGKLENRVFKDFKSAKKEMIKDENEARKEFMEEVERDLSSLKLLELNSSPTATEHVLIAPHAPVNLRDAEGTMARNSNAIRQKGTIELKNQLQGLKKLYKGETSLPMSAERSYE